jgi:hypothetical protein
MIDGVMRAGTLSAAKYSSLVLLIAQSACRILCGLAVAKALSSLGPARFGTLSQIIGISMVFYGFAGGAVSNGLVVNLGRVKDEHSRHLWLAAGLVVALAASAILAVAALILYEFGAKALLGDETLAGVFLGVAAAQVVISVGNILLSYSSGTGKMTSFAVANIAGTFAWMVLTVAATFAIGFSGAKWAVVLTPFFTAVIITAIRWRSLAKATAALARQMDNEHITALLRASGWMAIAMILLPLAQMIVRADLGQREGWYDVGLWQSVVRLTPICNCSPCSL